jgi:hypothetical protein
MNKSQELLKKFASLKSKYFDLPDGEEAKVTFLFAEEVPNNFDGGQTNCIRYHLQTEGIEQLWDRTSRELAQEMGKVAEGETILIRRVGQKNRTKYFITRIE